jgi:hypothetical protein
MTRIRFDGYALGSALSAPRRGSPVVLATAYRRDSTCGAGDAAAPPAPPSQRLFIEALYDAPLE